MLIDVLELCGLLFLSAVFTLIPTAPIHCRGSIGEQVKCYISSWCSDEETNMWPEGEIFFISIYYIYIYVVNHFFTHVVQKGTNSIIRIHMN